MDVHSWLFLGQEGVLPVVEVDRQGRWKRETRPEVGRHWPYRVEKSFPQAWCALSHTTCDLTVVAYSISCSLTCLFTAMLPQACRESLKAWTDPRSSPHPVLSGGVGGCLVCAKGILIAIAEPGALVYMLEMAVLQSVPRGDMFQEDVSRGCAVCVVPSPLFEH